MCTQTCSGLITSTIHTFCCVDRYILKGFSKEGRDLTDDETKAFLKAADKDGDGKIGIDGERGALCQFVVNWHEDHTYFVPMCFILQSSRSWCMSKDPKMTVFFLPLLFLTFTCYNPPPPSFLSSARMESHQAALENTRDQAAKELTTGRHIQPHFTFFKVYV